MAKTEGKETEGKETALELAKLHIQTHTETRRRVTLDLNTEALETMAERFFWQERGAEREVPDTAAVTTYWGDGQMPSLRVVAEWTTYGDASSEPGR